MFGFKKKKLDKWTSGAKEYLKDKYKGNESEENTGVENDFSENEIIKPIIDYSKSKDLSESFEEQTDAEEDTGIRFSFKRRNDFNFTDDSSETDENSNKNQTDEEPSKDDVSSVGENSAEQIKSLLQNNDRYDNAAISYAMSQLARFSSEYTSRKINNYLDMTFVERLRFFIEQKHWDDTRVYKAAQMDRRLFSKIITDRLYKPSKDTCVALCMALKLNYTDTLDMLSRAGYTFSHSNQRDVILEYCVREGIFNIMNVNEILYRLDQKPLGRQ